jgi:hypothetical protein
MSDSTSRKSARPSAEYCCAYRCAMHESAHWPPKKVLLFIKNWIDQVAICDPKNFDRACGTLDGLTDGWLERRRYL